MEAAALPAQELVDAPVPVDAGRAARKARRRPGVVPHNLPERIRAQPGDFKLRKTAQYIGEQLAGLHPSALDDDELAKLRTVWGAETTDAALQLLDRVGYGVPLPPKSRAERRHGVRREQQLRGVLGKLPRSIALRLPTSPATHREGRNDGQDVWGEVKCSMTLRADHIGLLAALGGLWSRAPGDQPYVDATAGVLASFIWSHCDRVGGKEVVLVHKRLAELESLQISADVKDKPGKDPRRRDVERRALGLVDGPLPVSGPSDAHHIPCSPGPRVLRRVGDHWVAAADYGAALAAASEEELIERYAAEGECSGQATIRVYLPDWFRAELAHEKRRPVFINFDVWRHLRPLSRRLYAYVQALGRDGYDDRIDFYLGPPVLYTLGLSGKRPDRAGAMVSADLTALWHADLRYHEGKGFRTFKRAGTNISEFQLDPARRPSAPTDKAKSALRTPPKRPRALRGAIARLRRYSFVAIRQAEQQDATRWMEAAKREAEQIRQVIDRWSGESRQAGLARPSFGAVARRRQGDSADDDEAAGS